MDDHYIELKDGRQLAYCLIGPEDGLPVLFFHGLAQSRLTIHPDTSILDELGIRLVTIDRPGIGLSSPQQRRTFLHWPEDITALADHLCFQRFAVLGHSAGAPYVAACAYRIPERVISATIVSGLPPPSPRLLRFILGSKFWKLGFLMFAIPPLIRPVIWAGIRYTQPRAANLFERDMVGLPDADRAVLGNPAMKDMRILSMLESFRQGSEGMYEEVALLRRPWGFDLSRIPTPISIYHGEADNIITIPFGYELATRINSSRKHFLPDLGHYMIFSHWELILRSIKEDVDPLTAS